MAAAARGATGLAQTVRRRDHRTSARPRTGPDQEGLLLGARPRRPTVAWRRAAGSGVQLCTGAQRRLRRSPAAGVHRHPANRRLCRLSRPCRSQAPRRSGDAGLLLGALAATVFRPRQIAAGADRHRGPQTHRRNLSDRSRDPRHQRRTAPRRAPRPGQAIRRSAEDLARENSRPARRRILACPGHPLWPEPLGRAGALSRRWSHRDRLQHR